MEDLDILPARDFSHSNLRPEPLRLPRRIHLGHQNENLHSPSNHFHTDKPTPRKHRPNTTERGETAGLVRPTTSGLAVLVAKFEMLGAAGDGNARAFRQPANLALSQSITSKPPACTQAPLSRRTRHKGTDQPPIPARGTSNAAADKITAATLSLAAMIRSDLSNLNTDQEAWKDHTPEGPADSGTSGD